jgi:DHA2 family multidrug resistance protein
MARNLGGSLGLALLGVFIDRRVEAHTDYLSQAVTQNSDLAQARLAGQAAGFAATNGGDMAAGQLQALASLTGAIRRQAMVLTYSECFWLLGIGLILLTPLVLLLRPPPKGSTAAEMMH